MKFSFANLGPISKAELELGDFTIISGHNNTGKTFIAYTLYGFMSKFNEMLWNDSMIEVFDKHFLDVASMPSYDILSDVYHGHIVEWEVDKSELVKLQTRLTQEVAQRFCKTELYKIFAMPPTFFENTSLDVDLEIDVLSNVDTGFSKDEDIDFNIRYSENVFSIELENDSHRSEYDEKYDLSESDLVESDINWVYSYILFQFAFESWMDPFILSSARQTIPLFLDELDFARSQWVRVWMEKRREGKKLNREEYWKNPVDLSNHALPVHDNINSFRSIHRRQKFLIEFPPNVFANDVEKMMSGSYVIRDGKLHFTASKQKQPTLTFLCFSRHHRCWRCPVCTFS